MRCIFEKPGFRLMAPTGAVLTALALVLGGCAQPTQAPPPINEVEQAEEEFRENEVVKEALETEPETIGLGASAEELTDLAAKVEEALAAYEQLPAEAKEALAEEKAALDGVKEKIGHVSGAHAFQGAHTETLELAKDPGGLQTPAAAAALLPKLHEALEAFEALPEAVQELLQDDKERLESLKTKAETLQPPPQHTITFDSHEGSAVGAITRNEGARVYKPADPVRTGYVFAGWFSEASGGELCDWPHTLTESITVHARWTAVTHAITYNLYGGDNHPGNPAAYTIEDLPLALADPVREGYRFQGWHDNGGFNGSPTSEIPTDSMGAKAFHARWTAIAYTAQYNANGGTGTMEPSSHVYDAAKNLSANAFVRDGYVFREWAAEPGGSGAVYADAASVLNLSSVDGAAAQLYAQWNYAVTYNLNGGSNHPENPASYPAGSPAIVLQAPSRYGYSFQGWHDNSGFTGNPITEIPGGSAGAKTFHARWSLDIYAITYELNGGNNDPRNPATYTVEDLPVALAAPTHPTREFAGWHRNAAFTGDPVTEIPPGGDQTLYAKWNTPAPIVINLQPQSNDPALLDVIIFEDGEAQFSAAGAGYESWQWRWDGAPIDGARSETYDLEDALKNPGVHELSVEVIAAGGQTLSARCRLTIKAK